MHRGKPVCDVGVIWVQSAFAMAGPGQPVSRWPVRWGGADSGGLAHHGADESGCTGGRSQVGPGETYEAPAGVPPDLVLATLLAEHDIAGGLSRAQAAQELPPTVELPEQQELVPREVGEGEGVAAGIETARCRSGRGRP